MTDAGTAATREFYDTVAATYAEMLPDAGAEAPLDLGMLEHFVASLPDSALPVLDAGCGTGRMLAFLAGRGAGDLVGVDLSPEMIGHARDRHPGIPLHVGDLRALPFADASMRGALCWYAVIHSPIDDVAVVARELARVVAPGGPVLLGFQSGSGDRVIERAYGHDVTLRAVLHDTGAVSRVLAAAGLDVIATTERRPVGRERSAQGFVLARRPVA